MGVDAAKLGGPPVHLIQKGRLVSVAQIPGDGAGRVVAAGQKAAVEQILQGYGLAAEQPRPGAVVCQNLVEFRLQPVGNGERCIQRLAALHQKQRGHQFGQAGRGPSLVLVFCIDQGLGVQLIQIHRLRLVRCALGRVPLGGGGYRQADGQRQQHHRAQKSGFQPRSSLVVEFFPRLLYRLLPAVVNGVGRNTAQESETGRSSPHRPPSSAQTRPPGAGASA